VAEGRGCILAALEGLGVALLPDRICRADLSAGRLVRVLIDHLADHFTRAIAVPPAGGGVT
jgi:DNA-binding transcriptional LysR family regulator